MGEDEKQWYKYLVKCPNCSKVFLPWKCLSITNKDTDWKTHCICPDCKGSFNRDSNFVNNN